MEYNVNDNGDENGMAAFEENKAFGVSARVRMQ